MSKNTSLSDAIVAEIELRYTPILKISTLPQIKDSHSAYDIFFANWDKTKIEFVEQFKVMLLNKAHRVLGICTISSGSSTMTIGDPRLVFAAALKANACSIIVAHNHPSGNLNPSRTDNDLSQKLKEGGRILDLSVLDHLIISTEGYYSFADEGAL
jgi:DNA repair protein RadC